ncbi:restriction endonuclease subunit S [Aggregatibacter actinomycetemcomitans]|uniref:restriction endonuclease subunit S n=1 Tax=Aggregatibacter actinomycetemcomitans TaxID=714 RepID=UPI00023FF481|nr:restriction endonuclease subunit S [Aggregatibacter actinomycetemcomitans]EHK90655.1 restriction modification system DNA specificity domain-containing protein [Aggregatibacter actinomycetemcomitans RhAA1]KNE77703.1 hypothetical protein RHAA2_02635 [Aggregatibacter actinomycetemcomitans RhAA1]MBN6074144.1 restriction endonuclease subunit S [Aggregatibacter actinomycetemcomitans]
MKNFLTIKANNYCYSVFDGTHATPKPCQYGYKLITSKNITSDGINIDDAYFISEQDYFEINKRSQVYQWDILFSMIGTVGNLYLEENSSIDYAIKNIGVFSCRDEFKAKWLFYYLQSPMARNHIKRFLNGAVQKFLSLKQLRDFPILPFEKDKISIVKILSALDKKIALNKQINARLEEMAKTLYDYWFVQFDFPDTNGKPYKFSGGEMVFDETLKREIPKGWEVKSLREIANFKNGINYSSDDVGDTNSYIVNVRNVSSSSIFIHTCDLDVVSLASEKLKTYQIKENTILVTRSGNPGATRLLVNTDKLVIYCGFIIAVEPKENNLLNLLFWFLKNQEERISDISAGTVLKNVSQDILKRGCIVIPDEPLLSKFNDFNKDILDGMSSLLQQNHHLTQLRDFLLPMLMNGQVSVMENK